MKNLKGSPGPAGLRRLSHHSSGAVKETTKMAASLQNTNPMVFKAKQERIILPEEEDDSVVDKIDEREQTTFNISLTGIHLIRSINDPEHPLTLEQLNVVEQSLVEVDDDKGYVKVQFTPTIPHCSMATLIGLAIRVQLLRSLPDRFKVDVNVTPGSHASEDAVNKQLGDKERVAAALENSHLLELVNQCLAVQQ
ncbi:Cytosolic iron-sulfur assembly component 2B [Acropora cervicornis]|uniref:Cytosolic iron-sulfur assembly component 2B n=1 Tax=Acropora cervicornis TaxID=6130 RepID=A0AAD9Q4F4_ACRCE|nr:Cytosolic iron-sulfur assembly component 2B [Acropora cervicornis]